MILKYTQLTVACDNRNHFHYSAIMIQFYCTSGVIYHISNNIVKTVYYQGQFEKKNIQIQIIVWPTDTCLFRVNNGHIRAMC